jgi:glycopeptide antibiotics resistance protein
MQTERQQTGFAFIIAASYLALIGILSWQALRGQSIIDPDAVTLAALGIWLAASAVAIFSALSVKVPDPASVPAR